MAKIQKPAYKFRPEDFIPVVGVCKYAKRNDSYDNVHRVHIGMDLLLGYNTLLAAPVVFGLAGLLSRL